MPTKERIRKLPADPGRRELVERFELARTQQDVQAAAAALQDWLRRTPDDVGIRDGGEVLALMEAALRERGAWITQRPTLPIE